MAESKDPNCCPKTVSAAALELKTYAAMRPETRAMEQNQAIHMQVQKPKSGFFRPKGSRS